LKLSILVADNDRGSRRQIKALLTRVGYETQEVQTGREALEAARRLQPTLVLVEVNLPEVSGYEVCHELREAFDEDVAIIFLSADRTEPYDRVAGLLLGADDYIVKPFDSDELLARVRSALRRFHAQPRTSIPEAAGTANESLTAREREVLKLLARGLDQGEIATALVITPKTVSNHIQHVLAKLGVHSRAQAVSVAHDVGLMDTTAS
jgi:DNA-binding NarL/FixJ family response regulator